jgi:hypothetical protein
MNSKLTPSQIQQFETFVTTCLSDPASMSYEELIQAINDNQEICALALQQIQSPEPTSRGQTTEADIVFLTSWLKARNLVIGGLQLLQMADPDNAASIQHEVECTETAFQLLPGLLEDVRP